MRTGCKQKQLLGWCICIYDHPDGCAWTGSQSPHPGNYLQQLHFLPEISGSSFSLGPASSIALAHGVTHSCAHFNTHLWAQASSLQPRSEHLSSGCRPPSCEPPPPPDARLVPVSLPDPSRHPPLRLPVSDRAG